MGVCNGCGVSTGRGYPSPEHCGECPPWTCDGCGEVCSMKQMCSCWVSLEGMNMADLKGLFARSDLSLGGSP